MSAQDDLPTPSVSSTSIESAGTLGSKDYSSLESIFASKRSPDGPSSVDGEEQALDSNEVLELQAFSERKEWIVEKIKVLSNMPPIELFAGIDSIRSSEEVAPGLPSRAELQQWLVEHDKIEKETEIFDSGELKKFKKFTKAVAKRNLSPEDTDLIELTLTTIYEFDKLVHLLRDRSENLDLLGVRLTWEEQRAAAWKERRSILADLQTFLATRARWSPSVYDTVVAVDHSLPFRRDSAASMASDTSASYPPGFSRTVRFKLAESLSRDAALFSTRISSLRHSRITVAGKALDKLIDRSRKPVPDEILDEQDSLEDQGINEMENIGKFVMSVVTQWRKADEFYVETTKDSAAAQALQEEIESAKLGHPAARQDAAFTSRASAITKRLLSRGNPLSSTSTLPRPTHSLFTEQAAANKEIAQLLSSELGNAMDAGRQAEKSAREYHTRFEAVKRVETLCATAKELSTKYDSIIERFMTGATGGEGDGSPPNLTTPQCLDATRHSSFLALLPSLLRELENANQEADSLLPNARAALLVTDQFPTDPAFKQDALAAIDKLASLKTQADDARNDIETQVNLLRDMRKTWALARAILQEVEAVRGEIGDAMEHKRWRQQSVSNGVPLTPESPSSPLLSSSVTSSQSLERLDSLSVRLNEEVLPRVSGLPPSLDPAVRVYMAERFEGLTAFMDQIKQMVHLSDRVQQQASAMSEIQDAVHGFQRRFADVEGRFESVAQSVLAADASMETSNVSEDEDLTRDAHELEAEVQSFVDGLSHKVSFVASPLTVQGRSLPVKRRFSLAGELTMDSLKTVPPLEIPFDLTALDESVRHDSNAYALSLMSGVSTLQRKAEYLRVARMAKVVDSSVEALNKAIDLASTDLTALHDPSARLSASNPAEDLSQLLSVADKIKHFSDERRSELSQSFGPIRELIVDMDAAATRCESPLGRNLYQARSRNLKDVESKFEKWLEEVDSRKSSIAEAQRLARERLAEEERLQAERERQLAEEQARLERERLEAEEKHRLEQERLIAEEQARLEKERLEAEERQKEAQRLLQEEEHARMEAQRAEERRLEAEELQRLAEERARAEEEARQERERLQAEIARLQAQDQDHARKSEEEMARRQAAEAELEAERSRRSMDEVRDEDVFGLRVAPATSDDALSQEDLDLQAHIQDLRQRLRTMSLHTLARPSASTPSLPSREQSDTVSTEFSSLVEEADALPATAAAPSVDVELLSLRMEVQSSKQLVQRLGDLGQMAQAVQECDAALSDLLEHVDSYPSPPGVTLSGHITTTSLPPEEQLTARLSYTHGLVADVDARHAVVADDSRAASEQARILQTWNELEYMASDLIQERKSRPGSAISSGSRSGRASRASVDSSRPDPRKKTSHFSTLSVGGPGAPSRGRGGYLKPPSTTSRRIVSNREDRPPPRSTSRASVASSRSVSGPNVAGITSRLTQSTFSSRQRTTSLTASEASAPTLRPAKPKQLFPSTSRQRLQSGNSNRAGSPALSEISSITRSFGGRPARLSFSQQSSTLPRGPRLSVSSQHRNSPPSKIPKPKKKYVADPKNKLDVAVGDVVNALPVQINIEVVQEGWKDQSGKYWIGGDDPKLCFCRILRSHTVMVRVGGGWMELSKFIKTHFADMFRLLPIEHTSPKLGSREEKWISSATLMEAPEIVPGPPRAPQTPEPHGTPPLLPSFALSTPSGKSPQSMKTTSSPGSPLTPLQFMRRADGETPPLPTMRPVTPSRPPSALRTVRTTPRGPSWRP